MSNNNLARTKALYILMNENGIAGVFTTKKLAAEHSDSERGDVLHIISIEALNTILQVTDYTPPTVPVLTYTAAGEAVADEEDLEAAEAQAQEALEAYYAAQQEATALPAALPRPKTSKERVLERLQKELGLEDDEDLVEADVDYPTVVIQQQPSTGGFVHKSSAFASDEEFRPM